MKKIKIIKDQEISLSDNKIEGFVHRKVCESSTGAVVYIPKEFIHREVYVVICK